MKFAKTTILLAVLFILVMSGCERKVINEVPDDSSAGAVACFTCHGDNEFALVQARQQYEMSVHGTGDTFNRNRNNSSRYSACEQCHTNEGFVANVTGTPAVGDHFSRIACFTCHAPHTNGTLQLRVTTAATLLDGTSFDKNGANLCASCHHSREDVSTYVTDDVEMDSRFGPHHSNQSDMLLGTNGYEYAGYEYDNSAHTNVTANGCLDCHMANSLYATGGHTFNVADEEEEYENTKGCNIATCHDGDLDDFDYEDAQTDVEDLLVTLRALLVAGNLWVDVDDEPVERVVATADSAGAVFNYAFVLEDRSHGVHNTDYAKGLLESAIAYLSPAFAKTASIEPMAAH